VQLQKKNKVLLGVGIPFIIAVLVFAPIIPTTSIFSYVVNDSVGMDAHVGPNVSYEIVRADGGIEGPYEVPNTTTNEGINNTAYLIFAGAADGGAAAWIALSDNSTAPGYTTKGCPATEFSTDGLDRTAATVGIGATANGDVTITAYVNFTYTGASATVRLACLMTDDTPGGTDISFALDALSPIATMGLNDKLNIQFNIPITS
jgi:hypothetical protein